MSCVELRVSSFLVCGCLLLQLVYHVFQLILFTTLAVIIMRLKLFWTPHMCLLSSLLASRQVCHSVFFVCGFEEIVSVYYGERCTGILSLLNRKKRKDNQILLHQFPRIPFQFTFEIAVKWHQLIFK